MQLFQNDRGFTLIEAMLALLFLAILTACFPLWLHVIDHPEKKQTIVPMEAELFFQEIGLEVREATQINTDFGKLILKKYSGEAVSYEIYKKGSYIRRKVDDQGNERVLQNVKEVDFNLAGKGVKVTVTGLKGETYERAFSQFAPNT